MRHTDPDVTMIHSSMADRFTVWKTDNELDSDHLRIVIRYEEPDSIPSVKSRPIQMEVQRCKLGTVHGSSRESYTTAVRSKEHQKAGEDPEESDYNIS